jgi:hypothetical protein
MTGESDSAEPETDTEETPDGDEKPRQEPPKRRILIAHGAQTVELEGPDDLDELAKLAAYFWILTSPPKTARLGFCAGETLITERQTGEYEEDRT